MRGARGPVRGERMTTGKACGEGGNCEERANSRHGGGGILLGCAQGGGTLRPEEVQKKKWGELGEDVGMRRYRLLVWRPGRVDEFGTWRGRFSRHRAAGAEGDWKRGGKKRSKGVRKGGESFKKDSVTIKKNIRGQGNWSTVGEAKRSRRVNWKNCLPFQV